MMAIEDTSILTDFEEEEKSNPSPRKIVGDRVIYASRQLRSTKQHGRLILCGFGQARFGSNTYTGDIQPYIYRAPEVVLRMPWNEKVDIWNVGVLVRIHFFQICLVIITTSSGSSPLLIMDADMGFLPTRASVLCSRFRQEKFGQPPSYAIMGPPPEEMMQNSAYATDYFGCDGMYES